MSRNTIVNRHQTSSEDQKVDNDTVPNPATTRRTGGARVPEPVRERILAFKREDDWDEDGGIGITEAACKASIQFLEAVMARYTAVPIPRISPSDFGAVTFQWRNGDEHLVIRVLAGSDLVSFHHEIIGEFREIGEEQKRKAIERVLRLFQPNAS